MIACGSGRRREGVRAVRLLYIALAYLLAPFAVLHFLWRARLEPAYARHLPERLGFGPAAPAGAVWLHAVSAGEVQAAAPLAELLRARGPERALLITTTTPAGRARAEALFGGRATVRYLPIDLPGAVRRFLAGSSPALGILLETELWPTLYAAAAQRGVPLLVASARLSPQSLPRYARMGALLRDSLRGVTIAAQTEADAARFITLGAEPARVFVTGNLKNDLVIPADVAAAAAALRARLGVDRPVWVAGSTHEGEEEVLLEAHRRVRAQLPHALLVLAPRHRPRFARVASLLTAGGWPFAQRSGLADGASLARSTAVLLLDSLGELLLYFAAADVAFVGGSLMPVGGHNPLEPAALGRVVLMGPYVTSAADSVALLLSAGALHTVQSEAELVARLLEYLENPARREQAGSAGRAAVEQGRGAGERVTALAVRLLDSGASGRRPFPAASR
jgi:3-deoxy-D-manno-octulosonic-acid transferase